MKYLKLLSSGLAQHAEQTPFVLKVQTYLETVRPYVFEKPVLTVGTKFVEDYRSEIPLDIPFTTVFLETLEEQPIMTLVYRDQHVLVHGVLVHEVSPRIFNFAACARLENGRLGLLKITPDEDTYGYVKDVCASHFAVLKDRVVCSEKVREKLSFKIDGEKKNVFIREVIHVRGKRFPNNRGLYGGPVDYSHRWEVSGHWRKIAGVGKDRYGKYGISGNTWVVPHVKGPDQKPLIRKQRVVHTTEISA